MKIVLEEISKRFNQEWVFRNFSGELEINQPTAVLGSNGSGKSTLLQIISGIMLPTSGKITYFNNDGAEIRQENVYRYISYSAPYMELPEELTMGEVIEFHNRFKKFVKGFQPNDLLNLYGLDAKEKQIKNFSSGMKQRLKLLLAILSDSPLLLLDEPCSNLDQQGIDWYRNLISDYSANRLVIVCSNHQQHEFDFCKKLVNIGEYKK